MYSRRFLVSFFFLHSQLKKHLRYQAIAATNFPPIGPGGVVHSVIMNEASRSILLLSHNKLKQFAPTKKHHLLPLLLLLLVIVRVMLPFLFVIGTIKLLVGSSDVLEVSSFIVFLSMDCTRATAERNG